MASRLRLAVTRLHRRLRQHAAEGLTQAQASALASIGQLGSPTLGALAAREAVQPPSMTRVVGALEALGHVSRVIDPTDRRVARVTLTAQGRKVLERSRSLKNAYLAQQLHRLPAEERQALGELTVLLERLVALDAS
jgi:DNA-binding MarR family transcriptional regulator